MFFRIFYSIILTLLIFVSSCTHTGNWGENSVKSGDDVKLDGQYIYSEDGILPFSSARPGIKFKPFILSEIGDSLTVYTGDYFEVKFRIDTSMQSIKTRINPDNSISLIVIPKKETVVLKFNDICDCFLLENNNRIEIIDNYNRDSGKFKNNPSKLIFVPNLSEDCKLLGYLVRYDLSERDKAKCRNQNIVTLTESKFENCGKKQKITSKNSNTPTTVINCKKNCPEWYFFRICCP